MVWGVVWCGSWQREKASCDVYTDLAGPQTSSPSGSQSTSADTEEGQSRFQRRVAMRTTGSGKYKMASKSVSIAEANEEDRGK